jgi:hypothetical protein
MKLRNPTPVAAAMNPEDTSPAAGSDEPGCQVRDITIPHLVAQVYEAAPAAERGHLLEQLLRPLGALSLVAVADGIFAKIRFRSGWQDLNVRLEDIQNVRASHVMALVENRSVWRPSTAWPRCFRLLR